jgi:hypothetical protein
MNAPYPNGMHFIPDVVALAHRRTSRKLLNASPFSLRGKDDIRYNALGDWPWKGRCRALLLGRKRFRSNLSVLVPYVRIQRGNVLNAWCCGAF